MFHPKNLEIWWWFGEKRTMGAASFLFEILIFLKQFLPITTTPSFILRPRTKPKKVWERRSCFGDGSKTPKKKGFGTILVKLKPF